MKPAWLQWYLGETTALDAWQATTELDDQVAWAWVWLATPPSVRQQRVSAPTHAWGQRKVQELLAQPEAMEAGPARITSQWPEGHAPMPLFENWVKALPGLRNPVLEAAVWEQLVAVADTLARQQELALASHGGVAAGDDDDDDEAGYDDTPGLDTLSNFYRRPRLPAAPAHLPFMKGLLAAGAVMRGERRWWASGQQQDDWMAPLLVPVSQLEGKLSREQAERWLERWRDHGSHVAYGFLERQSLMCDVVVAAPVAVARRRL